MKKYFLSGFAALVIAAISMSATHSSSVIKSTSFINKTIYDTVPNNMDTSHAWKDSAGKMYDTSTMRRDSSLQR